MALLPYTLIGPTVDISPLLVDSPHSGKIYPVDFLYDCPLSILRQAEDAFVDEIVAGAAEVGATVMMAEFPRSMIDVNRAENDIDPAVINGTWMETLCPDQLTRSGYGLVRRMCRSGIAIYRAPLPVAEIQRRLDIYYRPYHKCLSSLVSERSKKLGTCVLIDTHSMPDRIENNGLRADFVLGDRNGTSCAQALTQQAQKILQKMGYTVTLNNPYQGREIVQRYGLKGQGANALQVEINRRLYLDESKIEKHSGFEPLCQNMTNFFHELAEYVRTCFAEVAAE